MGTPVSERYVLCSYAEKSNTVTLERIGTHDSEEKAKTAAWEYLRKFEGSRIVVFTEYVLATDGR